MTIDLCSTWKQEGGLPASVSPLCCFLSGKGAILRCCFNVHLITIIVEVCATTPVGLELFCVMGVGVMLHSCGAWQRV